MSRSAAAIGAAVAPATARSGRELRRAGIVIGVYFLVLAYPVLRLGSALFPGWSPGTGELLAILVLPAAGWLGHQARRGWMTRWTLRLTYTWVGICFIGLAATVVWELAAWLAPAWSAQTARAAVLGTFAAALWSLVNAQRIGVASVAVKSEKLTRSRTVVQISDVHVGSRSGGFLRRVVERVRSLEPDVVVITGDLFDLRGMPKQALDSLAAIEAPIYFVIGNHERYIDCDAICAHLASLGVHVLRGSAASEGELDILGIDDAQARDQVRTELTSLSIHPSRFTVLLYHRPDGLEAAAEAGVDLMLCGHTHNGQIVPFNWLVRRQFPRILGRFRAGGTLLYVSPGTGTWGPVMRLGSRNEITRIELRAAEEMQPTAGIV